MALLVRKWGLAMHKDEEISGPGAPFFPLHRRLTGSISKSSLSLARGPVGGYAS